jgi:hypothetical protein
MRIVGCKSHLATPMLYLAPTMARYEKLARRMVLATPRAYRKFANDRALLTKLNDHLNITNEVNYKMLEAAGFKVFEYGNSLAFGISLVNPIDAFTYERSEQAMIERPGQPAVDLFGLFGIRVQGGELLTTPRQVVALHFIIQHTIGERNYKNISEILLDRSIGRNQPFVIYRFGKDAHGNAKYLIPVNVLNLSYGKEDVPVVDIGKNGYN